MGKPNHIQTFQGGMVQDVDAHLQPNGTYRDAEHGRLIPNPDASDQTMGHGLAFTNTPGNRFVLAVPEGYAVRADVESTLGVVLFSTNGEDSEIGLWHWDKDGVGGSYQTLYNDRYDPNIKNVTHRRRLYNEAPTERLGWRTTDTFDVKVIRESERIERIYWTNRRGPVHTLNLLDCYTSPGATYHQRIADGVPGFFYYPKHLSVHAFRERSDAVMPQIRYDGRVAGRLPSGAYQVAAQYRHKNGHESVYSTLTRRIVVSVKSLDDPKADRQTALRSNHHNRVMDESGIMTAEGLRFALDNVDVRWQDVRLAVYYFTSPDKAARRVLLNWQPIEGLTTLSFDLTTLAGEEVTDAQLLQRYDHFLSVDSIATDESRLIAAGLENIEPIAMDITGVTFTPKLRSIEADTTDHPTFVSKPNPISGRDDNDPITNSPIVEHQVLKLGAFGPHTYNYAVRNDRTNYKGQLYDSILKGHFRGETYEFGAVVLDRTGQPLFTVELPPYTFPELYAPGPNGEPDYYSLTKFNQQTGRYDLRIMLLVLSGLALPTANLYDAEGRLNVSGFMIVRRKRNARLRHQGVVFPVCRTEGCYEREKRDYVLFPLPTPDNRFTLSSIGEDRFAQHIGTACRLKKAYGQTATMGYYLTYHSPDLYIEETYDKPKAGDQLRNVGILGTQTPKGYTVLDGNHGHFYVKSYDTSTQFARLALLVKNGRPALGDTTRIKLGLVHNLGLDETYKEFDKDNLKLTFETQTHPELSKTFTNFASFLQVDGLLQRGTVLMKTLDWKSVDVAASEPPPPGRGPIDFAAGSGSMYRLVNYEQVPPVADTQNEPFMPTGHYQPLTQAILDMARAVYDTTGKLTHYVFDNIEIAGGDCYVNLFDFTRLYPFWSDACEKIAGGFFPDYAVSHIVPIESKYNLALGRWGRSFAANATKPQATSCDNVQKQFSSGISAQQPEDWKYNGVLSLEETVQFYFRRKPEQEIIAQRPVDFHWTPEKQAGARIDSWRIRYVGDYGSADASLGKINKVVTGTIGGLYVIQEGGFGVAPLNASQYATADGTLIVVNSGRVFTGMVQLSRQYGTQHPDSVWVSGGQIGFWDARKGVLMRHSQAGLDELSKQEHYDDYVKLLTVKLGAAEPGRMQQWQASAGVDENGDVLMSFRKGALTGDTLVYSPAIGAFTGRLPGTVSTRYGRRGRFMFSVHPERPNRLYIHEGAKRGEYFDRVHSTRLTLIVNPQPTVTKRMDNGFILVNRSGADQIASIRQWTPNGGIAQDHLIVRGDERIEWRDNMLVYPMHEWDFQELKAPLRDHYAIVEIEIDNSDNVPVHIIAFGCRMLLV